MALKVQRKPDGQGGWAASVEVPGRGVYRVRLMRGRPVTIPYKPRGQNRGWERAGAVYDAAARCVWSGLVTKSTGARWMLEQAGLVERRPRRHEAVITEAMRRVEEVFGKAHGGGA